MAWEQAKVEHVRWNDFAYGSGQAWEEVTWVGFRHQMTRDELCDLFGEEIGNKVTLVPPNNKRIIGMEDRDPVKQLFATAEVWEIWDKDEREVLFVTAGYKQAPLLVLDDPLHLSGFYPCPEPLYCIEDSCNLEPVILYDQYFSQAMLLEQIASRINRLTHGMRARGLYDATLGDIPKVLAAQDTELVPVTNVAALANGGLAAAINGMPIDTMAAVTNELSQLEGQCKAIIYELTGIADIMRGASNPEETATAQNLKSNYASGRLSRMQKAVQRFCRDVFRMMAEIIAEHFSQDTLSSMTQLSYPTDKEAIAQLQQQYQQAMLAYQQPQAAPPPPPAGGQAEISQNFDEFPSYPDRAGRRNMWRILHKLQAHPAAAG